MPQYDFKCEECGHEETRILRISQLDDLDPCEECKGKVRQVINHAPRAILKGGGWYRDGYQKVRKNKVSEKEVERYEKTGQAGF